MFEVKFFDGEKRPYVRHCDVGDLLPTIATMLQEFERDQGKYQYQRPYAIQWRQVRE